MTTEAAGRTYTGRDHPATSHEAAESVEGLVVTLRERVFRAVEAAGERGLIAEEIERETGLGGNTVRPRLTELRESGRLVQTEERRRTLSGRNALVWIALPEAAPPPSEGAGEPVQMSLFDLPREAAAASREERKP